MSYKSTHTGAQIDAGVTAALNPDATPTADSNALVKSGGVAAALANKADNDVVALKAPTNSPAFAGTPTAPTPTAGDNSTKVATTAFVAGEIATADDAQEQNIYNVYPTDTVENVSVASFTDGADGIPVKALTVNITPVQAGSGDPSPTNVRPISGWAGANIHVAKNSIQMANSFSDVTGYYKIQTTKSRIRKDYYGTTNNGRVMTAPQVESLLSPYNNLAAGKYKFTGSISGSQTISSVTVMFASWDGGQSVTATMNGAAVNVPEGMRIQTIDMNVMSWGAGDWIQLDDFAIVVEPSAVYAVSWQSAAGTVYGGTLTDNGDGTWTLTATHNYQTYDGTEAWSEQSNGTFYVLLKVSADYAYGEQFNLLSNVVKGMSPRSSSALEVGQAALNVNRTSVVVRVNMTLAEWTAFLGTTPMQIVVPLATPVSYTLTAESVRTLLGQNNIFADCGDIATLTYRADVGLYIEKKLAEA